MVTVASFWIVHTVESARYARSVCTGMQSLEGEPMPANVAEQALMLMHAQHLESRMRDRAARLGLSPEELKAGYEYACRMPWKQMQADYALALRNIGGTLED